MSGWDIDKLGSYSIVIVSLIYQKQNKMKTYSTLLSQALNAGFEIYCNTFNEDGLQGSILTNTKKDSPFDGEVLDIFEDGTFTHYSQFNEKHPHYKPISFKFN